jgi:hypothetical protein
VSAKASPGGLKDGLKDDGAAFTVPRLVSMIILSLVNEVMGRLTLVDVAEEPEKLTVPKLARGSTLQVRMQIDGASPTHSAELLAAVGEVFEIVKYPRRLLLRVKVKVLPETATSAERVSPGNTEKGICIEPAGYISYQA